MFDFSVVFSFLRCNSFWHIGVAVDFVREATGKFADQKFNAFNV